MRPGRPSNAPCARLFSRASARWVLYSVAFVLLLLAVRAVDRGSEGSSSAARESPKVPANFSATSDPVGIPALDLDGLARPAHTESVANLFGPSWAELEAEAARRNAPPPTPPPPPQAPPLPFAYLGKLVDGGTTLVFLSRGDRNYVVRQGDTIDGTYRVDEIGDQSIALTYVPLDSRQSLALGTVPSLGTLASLGPTPAIAAPLAADAPPQHDPTRLVWRAPPRVRVGEEFTVAVGLPAGREPRSGRLELIYDPRVLAVLGGATRGGASGSALVEVIGPGFPGALPTPSEVRFRVLAAEPTDTRIAIENLTARTRAGSPLALATPPAHQLAVVRAQGL